LLSKSCTHRLSLLVGQMQLHAASLVSKHAPASLTHRHGRVGFCSRLKPGTHLPNGVIGNGGLELEVPDLPALP